MLNRSEQRRLHAIERALEQDDPELVERLRAAEWKRPPDRDNRHLTVVTAIGLVVALSGLVLGPLLILVGLTLAIAGFWLRLLLGWSGTQDGQNGTNEADGQR